MKIKKARILITITYALLLLLPIVSCAQNKELRDHVLFYSSFDETSSADISKGDPNIYTAKDYKKGTKALVGLNDANIVLAKGQGLIGDALHFKNSKTSAVFYKAHKNVGYDSTTWNGTISFWLRLDPSRDLPPHYCDPLVVTDAQWNDAALWVDFTDHNPRQFRFGAMGDKASWNANDDASDADWIKRTVVVNPAPFQSRTWTHVAMVFSKVNTAQPTYKLYINGEYKGSIEGVNDPFTWEPQYGKIMLGLGYIGLMDELAIFDKVLTAAEVTSIFKLKSGLKTLF